jgi:hypothetical protein
VGEPGGEAREREGEGVEDAGKFHVGSPGSAL